MLMTAVVTNAAAKKSVTVLAVKNKRKVTTMKDPMDKYWKRLWKNVNMSSISGAAGMRTDNNPKLSGRLPPAVSGPVSSERKESSSAPPVPDPAVSPAS